MVRGGDDTFDPPGSRWATSSPAKASGSSPHEVAVAADERGAIGLPADKLGIPGPVVEGAGPGKGCAQLAHVVSLACEILQTGFNLEPLGFRAQFFIDTQHQLI